jgi:hypothetical protein
MSGIGQKWAENQPLQTRNADSEDATLLAAEIKTRLPCDEACAV